MPARRVEHLRIPALPRHPADSRLWRELCFARVLLRNFRVRILIILSVLLAGTIAFFCLDQTAGGDFLLSLYFTWLLIFGQPPEPLPTYSWLLMPLFFLIPILGLLIVIDTIVDFALTLRDRRRAERSWCVTMAQSMSDHIVLVGMGRLGYRTYRLLKRLGQAVVVVESEADNQFLDVVRQDGSPLLIADARRDAVLKEANVERARSIICATNNDLTNLEVALDSRRLNPKVRVILRMFDQTMADKVRDGFNIRIAMSQAALSAPTFAMAAIDASISNTFVVDDELVVMQLWTVTGDGPLAGKTVGDVLRELRFVTVKWQSAAGKAMLHPPPEQALAAGDSLMVQGSFEALLVLRKLGHRLT
jgi:voltage-gated potassium channel